MIKRVLIALSVGAVLAGLIAGCGSLPKSAVAEVNGKVITRENLERRIEDLKAQYPDQGLPEPGSEEYSEFEKQIVDQLVTEEILWFEAEKLDIKVTDEEINEQIDQFKQQAGGEEQFKQQLAQRNFTEEYLKEQLRKSLLFQKLYPEVTKDVGEITDEEAQKFYNENPTLFQQSESRTVRHILVKDEAQANQVKARLDAGEDFATVAKEVSQDPGTKDKGGDLGDVPTTGSGMVPEFEQAMNQLPLNQISAPVKSQFGYHIIQVTKISPAGQRTFEESKEEIKQSQAMENQRTAFDLWLKEIRTQYENDGKIEIAEEYRMSTTPVGVETGTAPAGASTAPAQPQAVPAQ